MQTRGLGEVQTWVRLRHGAISLNPRPAFKAPPNFSDRFGGPRPERLPERDSFEHHPVVVAKGTFPRWVFSHELGYEEGSECRWPNFPKHETLVREVRPNSSQEGIYASCFFGQRLHPHSLPGTTPDQRVQVSSQIV